MLDIFMKLMNKLKEMLKRKESQIKVRGEISGTDWAEVRMTNIKDEPITLGTPVEDLKIGIQTLTSGANGFIAKEYRIDNSHGVIHQHSGSVISPVEGETMSGSLMMLLGSDYRVLERINK